MKNYLVIGAILMLFLSVLFSAIVIGKRVNEKLQVYSPADVNPELVDASLQNVTKNHSVSDFELINQNGKVITQNDFKDKIYVVDFFFTSCPTICPIMTNNMEKIQNEFLNNDDIMLLSLSVTPEIDSVPKLREYANNKEL